MPQVTITIESVKCVTTQNNIAADTVYWISNIRNAECPPDPKYLDLKTIYGPTDPNYSTSFPKLVDFNNGQTKPLASPVFDRACPIGTCVYGTIHLISKHTPLTDIIAAILAVLSAIAASIAVSVGIGLLGAVAYAAITGAALAASAASGLALGALIALAAGLVALLTALLLAYILKSNDDNLGGTTIQIGPLQPPPPPNQDIRHDWNALGAGELTVLDANGATIGTFGSSLGLVIIHRPDYQIKMRIDIKGGHV